MSDERLDRIEGLVEKIRALTQEAEAFEAASASKRAEIGRMEAELSTLAVRRTVRRMEGRARSGERRDQILAMAREGLDRTQIRHATGLPSHVVNAALRRLRLSGRWVPGPDKKLS